VNDSEPSFIEYFHEEVNRASTHEVVYFCMDIREWESIQAGDGKLLGSWREHIVEKISRIYPICPIAFDTYHVKKEGSRKVKKPYFHVKAHCVVNGKLL
jgi:hypothetical protein